MCVRVCVCACVRVCVGWGLFVVFHQCRFSLFLKDYLEVATAVVVPPFSMTNLCIDIV